jgi:predicted Zn-dependent protease
VKLAIRRTFRSAVAALAALIAASFAAPATAQQQISFIRDAEIENTIRLYAAPVFKAGGFDARAIKIHLVNDRSLNAFVALGLNMFFHTGLLVRADDPSQVIGVMAHELGHITGGHLARMEERMRQAQNQSIVTFLLAGAAAIVTGRGDAAAAVLSGGQQATLASLLQYSQTQESAADQAGLKFLDDAGVSARGLGNFLRVLENQELLSVGRQDPYMRTHPVTRARIEAVEAHIARSPFTNASTPPEFLELHKRMRAKLFAFMEPPVSVVSATLQRYPETDTSIAARYARAIAYHRKPDMQKALDLIDDLLADEPNNPYFHELKGQMLFENGRAADAVPSLDMAVKLLPDSPLIRTLYGQILIEVGDSPSNQLAIQQLEQARKLEEDYIAPFRLLAIAYGREGNVGMASLSQAEFALGTGKNNEAKAQADRAMKSLRQGTPQWLRAQDIKTQAEIRQKGSG